MKVFESKCTFDYSWEEVSRANWRKYCAWNDKSTHVIAVDTIDRTLDPNTGIVSLSFIDIILLYYTFEQFNGEKIIGRREINERAGELEEKWMGEGRGGGTTDKRKNNWKKQSNFH